MPAYVLSVLPVTFVSFDALAPNTTQEIPVAKRVFVGDFQEVQVIFRVHALSTPLPTGAIIELEISADGSTADDPTDEFNAVGQALDLAVVQLTPSFGAAGDVNVLDLADNTLGAFGDMVTVKLLGTRLAAAGPINCKVSVDFVMKTAGKALRRRSYRDLWVFAGYSFAPLAAGADPRALGPAALVGPNPPLSAGDH